MEIRPSDNGIVYARGKFLVRFATLLLLFLQNLLLLLCKTYELYIVHDEVLRWLGAIYWNEHEDNKASLFRFQQALLIEKVAFKAKRFDLDRECAPDGLKHSKSSPGDCRW
jgi:hypothetical protein